MKSSDPTADEEWAALVGQAVGLPQTPPHLVQWALALRPAPVQASRGGAGMASALKRLVAQLKFDTWEQAPLAAGMRALPSEQRQLMFTSPKVDVDLRIQPSILGSGDATIRGQLFMTEPADAKVRLNSTAGEGSPVDREVTVDALGEFQFDQVPGDCIRLTVCMADLEVELPLVSAKP